MHCVQLNTEKRIDMKEYRINDCGMCVNADQYGTKVNYIKVALFPDGKWRFGASWHCFGANYAGGGFGCGFGQNYKDQYAHETERACINAGAKFMQEQYDRYMAVKQGDCRDLSDAISQIKSMLQPKQLSLF